MGFIGSFFFSSPSPLNPKQTQIFYFLFKKGFRIMDQDGYAVELQASLPKLQRGTSMTFSHSQVRLNMLKLSGEYACTAYVTFKNAYSQETAVLLSGATILDQRVCITRWGHCVDEFDLWNRSSSTAEDETESNPPQRSQYVSTPGEAVTVAQEVVKNMLAKGYSLGKDALSKAKAFDESHQVTATAAAKVAEFTERTGLADKIFAGVEAVKSVDQKYHVSEMTKSAVSATGRTTVAAANTVVNSSYFSKGALWVSDALNRAAKVAADLGSRNVQK